MNCSQENRKKKDTAIVVPVYKELCKLSDSEINLLNLVSQIFSKREMFLAIPESIFKKWKRFKQFNFIPFQDDFFKDKFSYSNLLCRKNFYHSFNNFEYIQIVQTDCWIFEDNLDHFIDLGFDYIGAPWMKGGFEGKPQKKLWKVGNGGFSLRKVDTFLKILNSIENSPEGKFPVFKNLNKSLIGVLKNLGLRNNLKHYVKNAPGEDIFWSIYVPQIFKSDIFKIADTTTAAHYSFEVLPEFLFNKVTNKKLPMGCHNWMNNNQEFWKKFIQN